MRERLCSPRGPTSSILPTGAQDDVSGIKSPVLVPVRLKGRLTLTGLLSVAIMGDITQSSMGDK